MEKKKEKEQEELVFQMNGEGTFVQKKSTEKKNEKKDSWQYIALLAIVIVSFLIYTSSKNLSYVDSIALSEAVSQEKAGLENYLAQNQNYLSDSGKELFMEQNLEMDKKQIEENSKIISKILKQKFTDDNGNTYFFSPDDYYFLRQARYLSETPVQNDFYKASSKPSSFLPFVEFSIYRIGKLIDHTFSIEGAASYYPVILGLLTTIIFYFLAKRFVDIKASLFATAIFSLHPIIFLSERISFADTNSINIFFSVVLLYLFARLSEQKFVFSKNFFSKNKEAIKTTAFFLLSSVIAIWLFSITWNGYLYIVLLFFLFLAIISVMSLWDYLKKYIAFVSIALVAVLASAFFVVKNSTFGRHLLLYLTQKTEGIYPSVFSSITELQRVPLSDIPDYFGGKIIVFLLIISLVFLLYSAFKQSRKAIFVLCFLIPLFFAFVFAVRFVPYFVIVLAIALGFGFEKILNFLKQQSASFFEIKKELLVEIFIIFFLAIIVFISFKPIYVSYAQSPDYSLPVMDDSLVKVSDSISRNSSNAFILSWWDFGYMYEYYARREVLFDGGNFDGEKLYWFSEALTTKDENRSANIMKMLSCRAENLLDGIVQKKGYAAFGIIESILSSEDSAKKIIEKEGLDSSLAEKIYCKKDAFLVLSSDLPPMYYRFESFAHPSLEERYFLSMILGKDYPEAIKILKPYFGENASDVLFEMSKLKDQMPKKYFSIIGICKGNETLSCANGLYLNLSSRQAAWNDVSVSYFYFGENESFGKDEGTPAVMLFYKDEQTIAAISEKESFDSMFSRLYFGRKDTPRFKRFLFVPESFSRAQIVYRVE